MNKIVECVPNFSEGRDTEILNRISEVIKKSGAELLDVDPGMDTNRTVFTFAGSPEHVLESAFQAIKTASELIDMSVHSGAHPRMGATDVCPFIPVSGITMEECVELANKLGKRVAEELNIPIYLYEYAAKSESRKSLANIRLGEYEALPEKLKNEDFLPDYGEPIFNKKSGATVIGAREFLIAYNINLNTRNIKLARKIANRIREKGRRIKNKETGKMEQISGSLTDVRGMGWYIDEYNMAQLSFNLLNYNNTPVYRVFEEAEKYAREFGLRVTGSELVGLIPLEAMLQCGRYFLKKQGYTTGVSEEEFIRIAIQTLGLDELSDFDPQQKIIEYRIKKRGKLASMNIFEFTNELASDSPAPGGGSVAALNGSLSAGLTSMVGNLTYNKKIFKEVKDQMIDVSDKAQRLKERFTELIDKDTDAFNLLMRAFSLPKSTPEEQLLRNQAIVDATKEATLIPFSVLEQAKSAAELALIVVEKGNKNSISDAGVAGLTASTAAEGALYNVMINLEGLDDKNFCLEISNKAQEINRQVQEIVKKIKKLIGKHLKIKE